MEKDNLRIASRYYYGKSFLAFFRSFELEEYTRAGVRFEHPVMDLGCGDGTFATMLQETGLLDSTDVSIDYSMKDLLAATKAGHIAIQGDVMMLPFRNGTFASVLANGVLCCVKGSIDQLISEVYRILVDKGVLVLTVATPWFNQNLLIPKMLSKVGLSGLATRYLERLNGRLFHYHMFDEQAWLKKLEQAGFHAEQVRYYFTPHEAFWWSLMLLRYSPFRVFALSRILEARWIKQLAARITEKMFRPVFEKERSLTQVHRRNQAGYLLITVRKTGHQASARGRP